MVVTIEQHSDVEATNLLISLYERGVLVSAKDGNLRVRAAKDTLSTGELRCLSDKKQEIMMLLERLSGAPHPMAPRDPSCTVLAPAGQQRAVRSLAARCNNQSHLSCGVVVRIIGGLDPIAVEASIRALIKRHEALRTRFVLIDEVAYQYVDPESPWRLEHMDLTHLAPADAEREIERLAGHLVDRSVDISVGPLFAAQLCRLAHPDWALLMAFDHIISDGMSLEILINELWLAYEMLAQGRAISLPKQPLQYPDFVVWQELTRLRWMRDHSAYWMTHLADAPCINFPCDKTQSDAPVDTALLEFNLDAALISKLRAFSQHEGALLPLILMSAYLAVMARWCNRSDLVLSMAYHGRCRDELSAIVGCLVNELLIRVSVTKTNSFIDLLNSVGQEYFSALDHLDFDRARDLLPEISTDLDFAFLHLGSWQWSIRNLHGENIEVNAHHFRRLVTSPPLSCFVFETDANIEYRIEYRADLLSRTRIQDFVNALVGVTQAAMDNPRATLQSINEASICSAAVQLVPKNRTSAAEFIMASE